MSRLQEQDYSSTLFLPQTDFAMRAALPQKEPEILQFWQKINLYNKLREKSKDSPKYILHDGPPYANGNLHIGHALNKIIKDVIARSKQMQGYNAPLILGWDCHGLPIEWKIEEELRSQGKDKDDIAINEFRKNCRDFAASWVKKQGEQFQRLGILADFDKPYLTMDYATEARICQVLLKFIDNKLLYRGSKPIMWSVTEKTALAEAEIEYHQYESDAIWVKFPIKHKAASDFTNAYIVIWTTTPWTIPANRAVCYNSDIDYALYEITANENSFGPQAGEKLILAAELAQNCAEKAKVTLKLIRKIHSKEFLQLELSHPFSDALSGYQFMVPMLDGSHVTVNSGTGFVHTAPSHGRDDFEIWCRYQHDLQEKNIDIKVPFTLDDDGYYTTEIAYFGDEKHKYRVIDEKGKKGNANEEVIKQLINANNLFARGRIKHSYPHSWRSKKPLISRNTPQWFISLDKNCLNGRSLRQIAQEQISQIKFKPNSAQTRLNAMIKDRPDWVVSRQRSWGVPICVFVNKQGDILQDEKVNQRIIEALRQKGADCWFEEGAREYFLGEHQSQDWQQVVDILDVWFDSGSSFSYVLQERPELDFPADLYLEGSDQHRGWFQSSLLISCATKGISPYKELVTHGFSLDEKGHKMSKSLGNVVDPQNICKKFGADILRLWAVSCDYCEDQRVGDNIIQMNVDYYRKLRNVIRWMLGSLHHYQKAREYFAVDQILYEELPALEQYILHLLAQMDILVKEAYNNLDFKKIIHNILDFCITDLSAFYFDIRKDALYCDAPSSKRRLASLYVIDKIFNHLILWLAPILPFTAEEAWQIRQKMQSNNSEDSVHLQDFLPIDQKWHNVELAQEWQVIRKLRKVVTGALELARVEKIIGSSLEAAPIIYISDKEIFNLVKDLDLADICITSDIQIIKSDNELSDNSQYFHLADVANIAVKMQKAQGKKCSRSWRYSLDVVEHELYGEVSSRDAKALDELQELGWLSL